LRKQLIKQIAKAICDVRLPVLNGCYFLFYCILNRLLIFSFFNFATALSKSRTAVYPLSTSDFNSLLTISGLLLNNACVS